MASGFIRQLTDKEKIEMTSIKKSNPDLRFRTRIDLLFRDRSNLPFCRNCAKDEFEDRVESLRKELKRKGEVINSAEFEKRCNLICDDIDFEKFKGPESFVLWGRSEAVKKDAKGTDGERRIGYHYNYVCSNNNKHRLSVFRTVEEADEIEGKTGKKK